MLQIDWISIRPYKKQVLVQTHQLVLQCINMRLYLKLGTGDPWAGHDKLRDSVFLASNPSTLATTDILGWELPIGSGK